MSQTDSIRVGRAFPDHDEAGHSHHTRPPLWRVVFRHFGGTRTASIHLRCD